GIALLLVLTNPDTEAYADYFGEELAREAGDDQLAGALVSIFGGVAENLFANATTRDNYVLFSIYTTSLNRDEIVTLGILGNFIVLKEPEER
ncbi:MAG: DUF4359 domain-containing protein, partial [Pseudomonadota bacterium]|nr:DUF4359 domain-containing protein [Pseudomonadota bacterium]